MSKLIVIDNEFVTLLYHSDKQFVHHTIHQPIDGQVFRFLLTQGRELLENHSATKWLSDNRGMAPLTPADMEWSTTEWIPCTLEAGWKYWALVVSNESQARANLAPVVNTFYDQGLQIMIFTNLEEAVEWLDRQ